MISQMTPPNLEGRQAKCQCGAVKPSSTDLGMFEFRGEGSRAAQMSCEQCGYYEEAHNISRYFKDACNNFQPHGPYETDLFWDGCGNAD